MSAFQVETSGRPRDPSSPPRRKATCPPCANRAGRSSSPSCQPRTKTSNLSFLLPLPLPLLFPEPLHLLWRHEGHHLEDIEREEVVLRRVSQRRWREERSRRSPVACGLRPQAAAQDPSRLLAASPRPSFNPSPTSRL